MKPPKIARHEYLSFVTSLKKRINTARISAVRAVNRDLILLYWDIGKSILEKQKTFGWGDSVVETLARDLQEAFPELSGFSERNLWDMRRFYGEYASPDFLRQVVAELDHGKTNASRPSPLGGARKELASRKSLSARQAVTKSTPSIAREFLRQLVAEIPWGHHLLILNKVAGAEARLFYLRASARFGWSRNVLLNQIKAETYERSLAVSKTHNFPLALPEHLVEQADEAMKSSYNLGFLGLGCVVHERELECRLLENLRDFILELGYGFCFVGSQYRLTLGAKEYFIDLLFYHRFLKALVAVELKTGSFEPEYAGKMDFYLNLLNDTEKAPGDHPSIGIILCAERDRLEVEYSLKTKSNPIGVAEYELASRLPKELKGKLPSERQLVNAMKNATEASR